MLWVGGDNGSQQLWPGTSHGEVPLRIQRHFTHLALQSSTGFQAIACTEDALVALMDGRLWMQGVINDVVSPGHGFALTEFPRLAQRLAAAT